MDINKFNRDYIVGKLRRGIVHIVFEKANGEMRNLAGTLDFSQVDAAPLPENKTDRVRKYNPDVINCWDVENNGWRSFKVDSVKEVFENE